MSIVRRSFLAAALAAPLLRPVPAVGQVTYNTISIVPLGEGCPPLAPGRVYPLLGGHSWTAPTGSAYYQMTVGGSTAFAVTDELGAPLPDPGDSNVIFPACRSDGNTFVVPGLKLGYLMPGDLIKCEVVVDGRRALGTFVVGGASESGTLTATRAR